MDGYMKDIKINFCVLGRYIFRAIATTKKPNKESLGISS